MSTGERSLVPPSYPSRVVSSKANDGAQLPLQKAVVLVGAEGENTLTRHTYKEEYASFKGEIEELAAVHDGATQINKYARRKLGLYGGQAHTTGEHEEEGYCQIHQAAY